MGQLRRVVVTGLGMVSPIACGVEATWRRLLASELALARVENFDVSDLPCKVAAQVPRGNDPDAFHPDDWMDPKEQRRVDDFIIYGMSAATQALRDASWSPKSYEEEIETGVLFGSGIGGLGGIYDASVTLHEKGPRRISPFFIPGRLINLAERTGFDRPQSEGPQPRGGHGVLDRRACDWRRRAADRPWRRERDGRGRRRIGGQSPWRSPASPPAARFRPASTTSRSRPRGLTTAIATASSWAKAPACVVLEELEHAKARGARIYAELIGYGLSGDAYHITAPAPDGDGAFRAMSAALKRAELSPSRHRLRQRARHFDPDRRRDRTARGRAPARQFGAPRRPCPPQSRRPAISSAPRARWRRSSRSSPSATRSRRRRSILITPPSRRAIDLAPHVARKRPIQAALSNSFGFGGTNASLVFSALH